MTSAKRGLALNYHLRSNSGSNGPIAKECHRFLVVGPFKFESSDVSPHSRCAVSNPRMRRIRYALLLPLMHLGIAGPPMFHQESTVWRYVPQAQELEDFEAKYPAPEGGGVPVEPCYEYRFSSATRTIVAANLPTALLVGASADGCASPAARLIPNRVKYQLSVKTWVIALETLIVLGIIVQWWLVGGWLDQRYTQSKPTRRWIIPVTVITVGAVVMASTAFGHGSVAEPVNIFAAMITLLAWIVLIVMFAVAGRCG